MLSESSLVLVFCFVIFVCAVVFVVCYYINAKSLDAERQKHHDALLKILSLTSNGEEKGINKNLLYDNFYAKVQQLVASNQIEKAFEEINAFIDENIAKEDSPGVKKMLAILHGQYLKLKEEEIVMGNGAETRILLNSMALRLCNTIEIAIQPLCSQL